MSSASTALVGAVVGATLLGGGFWAGRASMAAPSAPAVTCGHARRLHPSGQIEESEPGVTAYMAYAGRGKRFVFSPTEPEFEAWLRELDRRERSNDPLGIRPGGGKP